jgi:hypothetical protein
MDMRSLEQSLNEVTNTTGINAMQPDFKGEYLRISSKIGS